MSKKIKKTIIIIMLAVQGVQDVLGGLGLGVIAGQLADLKLGELLDTPPPGLDEAVAIAKVKLIVGLNPQPCMSAAYVLQGNACSLVLLDTRYSTFVCEQHMIFHYTCISVRANLQVLYALSGSGVCEE